MTTPETFMASTDDSPDDAGQRPGAVFTVSEAAEACQVDRRTVTRKLSLLEASGAWKDAAGQWRIPISALFAVGLRPGKPKGPDVSMPSRAENIDEDEPVGNALGLRTALEKAEIQLAERDRLLAERERTIGFLEMALRQLPAPAQAAETAQKLRDRIDFLTNQLSDAQLRAGLAQVNADEAAARSKVWAILAVVCVLAVVSIAVIAVLMR